jgi:hypothetical protein
MVVLLAMFFGLHHVASGLLPHHMPLLRSLQQGSEIYKKLRATKSAEAEIPGFLTAYAPNRYRFISAVFLLMQVVGQFRFKGMELSMKMSGVVVWPSRIC